MATIDTPTVIPDLDAEASVTVDMFELPDFPLDEAGVARYSAALGRTLKDLGLARAELENAEMAADAADAAAEEVRDRTERLRNDLRRITDILTHPHTVEA